MLDTIDVNVKPAEGCRTKRLDDSAPTNGDYSQVERAGLKAEISKQVIRKKLAKQRHLVVEKAIHPEYLDSLFPALLEHFDPQVVNVSVVILGLRLKLLRSLGQITSKISHQPCRCLISV
jgi:hypothetical protein